MKNIHVLPKHRDTLGTRIAKIYSEPLPLKLSEEQVIVEPSFKLEFRKDGMFGGNSYVKPQEIYITSDEQIDEDDYRFDYYTNTVYKTNRGDFEDYPEHLKTSNKIILTTDKLLIKDGVQAIDDEFLEWWIKNPTCEEVDISTQCLVEDKCNCNSIDSICKRIYYTIDIPKEEPKYIIGIDFYDEPKEETRIRDYSNRSCQTCNLFNTNNNSTRECELKLETECASYNNDESLGDFWISCLDDESDSVIYKQETLEGAAENYSDSFPISPNAVCGNAYQLGLKDGFIAGAKWQEQRMFSEEEVLEIAKQSYNKALSSVAYSEIQFGTWFNKWFEQFKKK